MRVTLLSAELGNRMSGQSRFALNLALGLRRSGIELSVCAAAASADVRRTLQAAGVPLTCLERTVGGRAYQSRLLLPGSHLGRDLAQVAVADSPADWFLVLSDEAVDAVEGLGGRPAVYISNGDLSLLFLNRRLYDGRGIAMRALSGFMATNLLRHAELIGQYRRRLANSEFTRQFLSYLYGTLFDGVVFPPVDPTVFHPTPPTPGEPYVLALARNRAEPALPFLAELAKRVPVTVVGGARVAGCQTVNAPSDSELAAWYAGAQVVVAPTISEFFGYSVAESLACGTPVVVPNVGGPAEQVRDGVNGWVCGSIDEMLSRAEGAVRAGTTASMRQHCVVSSRPYTIERVSESLLRTMGWSA
ncbi:MAG: glycosyltransferase family 4 protein [Thermoplasmata archaeon]|nr:glycosyltransferase family 4 protein [Thermoplasmata archaeon]